MHTLQFKATLAALAATAILAGCSGGSGGDDPSAPNPPPTARTEIPDSALQNSAGLVAYVRQLVGSTSETSEPLVLGDVVLPVDDTAEPAAVN